VRAFTELIAEYTVAEQAAMLQGNARQLYRWPGLS